MHLHLKINTLDTSPLNSLVLTLISALRLLLSLVFLLEQFFVKTEELLVFFEDLIIGLVLRVFGINKGISEHLTEGVEVLFGHFWFIMLIIRGHTCGIVNLSQFFVAKCFVGFVDFEVAFFGFLSFIDVGVVLLGKSEEALLDFVLRSTGPQPKVFIELQVILVTCAEERSLRNLFIEKCLGIR